MKYIWSRIFLCNTHKRFKQLFEKMEAEGYKLFVVDEHVSEYKIRRFIKNLKNVNFLYEKFIN